MAKREPFTFNGVEIGSGFILDAQGKPTKDRKVPWNKINLGTVSAKSAEDITKFLVALRSMTLADQKAMLKAGNAQHNATVLSAVEAKVKYDHDKHRLVITKFGDYAIADKEVQTSKAGTLSLVA